MGAFDALVREMIQVASDLTVDFQATVVHRAYTGQDEYRKPTYGSPVSRQAVVTDANVLVMHQTRNVEVLARYNILFLSAVTVDPKDEISVNGRVQPIARVDNGVLASDGTGFTASVLTE
jgi:hypothetical protein